MTGWALVVFALQNAALVVGVPLLWLYMRERVTNLPRQQTEKALADYRHQHELALATLNAQHQRRVEELGLRIPPPPLVA